MALIGSLTSGVSAMNAFSNDLNVIGNNISNVNTTGFKSSSTTFADAFSNTISGTSPMQVGTGVGVSRVEQNFTQGALTPTGVTSNVAISGNGFFTVKNPISGESFVTRDGTFSIDTSGYLVNAQGYHVEGLNGGSLGDIKLGTPPSGTQLTSYAIDAQGNFTESYSDGTTATTNQILLQNFTNPAALSSVGGNLYTNITGAGPVGGSTLSAANNTAGSNGLGAIQSGTVEGSNVDLTSEMANMITAQRSFQAASRVITVSDTLLEEIVNLKRS